MQPVESQIAPTTRIASWIQMLGSKDPRQRAGGREALKAAGADAIGPLVQMIEEEGQGQKRYRAIRFALTGLVLGLYFWMYQHLSSPIYWSLILAILPLIGLVFRLKAASTAQIEAAHILAVIDDTRAIGPLAEALEYRDLWRSSGTNGAAVSALARLLPLVNTEDSDMPSQGQRACLYRILHADRSDPPYVRLGSAILDAAVQWSDPTALRHFEQLASQEGYTLARRELSAHARALLPELRARLESHSAPQILLRASEESPETLLRPAASQPDSDPLQLLRSSQGSATE